MSIGGERTSRKPPPGPSSDALETRRERERRARAGLSVAGELLPPVGVDLEVLAHLHRDAGTGVAPGDSGLCAAPKAKAGGEILVDWPGQRERAFKEVVAGAHSDEPALE